MRDSINLTISPLGTVALPTGATWGSVRGQVAELFDCSAPLQLVHGHPPRPVAAESRVGSAPLLPNALLFVHDGGRMRWRLRRHQKRCLWQHRRRLNRERRAELVAGARGSDDAGWARWQPAALSAIGSVTMAATLRQPMFALLGLLGLLGFLPNLWRRKPLPGNATALSGPNSKAPLPNTVPLAGLLRPVHKFKIPLGIGCDGNCIYFDLIRDGPHLLIAGTTGAGKSVVLRSLILALAYQLDPTELALALVDFKGGASFGDCQMLPHVVGLVTDLDTGLADRALAGLRAELVRRKEVLRQHGVSDIAELPAGVLPRLVVVFDEFRALTEELPDAVPQLFRIAAQGRSLGIHLILATQRAAGAVSPEVRANVSARLALRVVELGDSVDLVDSPLAAGLPAVPGRAVLRLGASPPQLIQCAWADAAPLPKVWRRDVPFAPTPLSPSLATQILLSVGAAASAPVPRTQPAIWLPPLPDFIPLDTLITANSLAAGCRNGIPFGLGDYPDLQKQTTVSWHPEFGNLGIIGRDARQRSNSLNAIGQSAIRCGWKIHLLDIADPPAALELLQSLLTEPTKKAMLLIDNAERWRDHYQVCQLITACSQVAAIAVSSGSPSVSGFANLIASKLVLLSNDANEDVLLGAPTKFAGKGMCAGRAVWFDAADSTGYGPALTQIANTQNTNNPVKKHEKKGST